MRLTGLLAILLFLAIVFFAAPAASYGQTADSVAPAATISPEISKRIEMSPRLTRRTFSEERRDGVCYTMRTYIVARESRDSDVTVPKSYQECLPEWKLQMRTTEQKLIDSSSR
jgi:hypothetical protein